MFTEFQIQEAHAQVKSGADFPRYAQQLRQLGLTQYTFFVATGTHKYLGKNGYFLTSKPRYAALAIAETASREQLIASLQAHQQGQTDFPTFCRQAAASGIEKWVTDLENRVVTYFDKQGQEVLIETIPDGNE